MTEKTNWFKLMHIATGRLPPKKCSLLPQKMVITLDIAFPNVKILEAGSLKG